MSYVCAICGKKNVMGRSQKHKRGVAGKRWKKRAQVTPRLFVANLQIKNLIFEGQKVKVKVCTKCLKRIRNFGSHKGYVLPEKVKD